jgi:hypothetical protein
MLEYHIKRADVQTEMTSSAAREGLVFLMSDGETKEIQLVTDE